ncbi:MAG: YCF48-related protein [Bacteroidota bacterium]|nr:YCF48-related protein [Bacteroidota bacterium]
MKTIIIFLPLAACIALQELPAQWTLQNSSTATSITDVVMLDSSTAIAVGRNGSIFRTTNSGITWVDVAAPLSYIKPWNAVSFFDTANGIVVGDDGVVMTSANGGKNWMWHQIPAGRKCFSVLQTGQYSYFVGSDSGWVFHSVDTGNTWISEKISAWPIRSLFRWRGAAIDGAPIYYALTPYSILIRSTTIPPFIWSEKILPQFQGLGSEGFSAEFCNGGGSGFIVGVQGDLRADPTILRKKMSDTAWSTISTGILRDGELLGVSAPSANTIYVCGSGGMIFKSTTGGDTWADISEPTTQTLHAIYFYNEKRGFVVGDSGKIFFTMNGGGITSVEEGGEIVPTKFELYQNYPNPFNPTTVISYQLSVTSYVSLKVYDLLGRDVATLVDELKSAGKYFVQWKSFSLSSGIYFYRLQAGNYSDVKKLMIIQ